MAHKFAEPFYKSKEWKKCRKAYIAYRVSIDGGMCECCHEKLGYIVHHKIMLTRENIDDPDVTLNWDNLSYECKECHDKHEGHGVGVRTKPVVLFDEDGNVIKILDEFKTERL